MAPPKTEVLYEVAYPANLLWVPYRIFAVNGAGWAFAAAIGQDWFWGFGTLMAVAGAVATHVWVAFKYRRDPHVEKVWLTRLAYSRRMPWQRTQGIFKTPGVANRYVA